MLNDPESQTPVMNHNVGKKGYVGCLERNYWFLKTENLFTRRSQKVHSMTTSLQIKGGIILVIRPGNRKLFEIKLAIIYMVCFF